MRFLGRKKPYTARGIRRVPCCHCGKPSETQWQVCANRNRYQGLCERCDFTLNRIALRFMRHPCLKTAIKLYEKQNLT